MDKNEITIIILITAIILGVAAYADRAIRESKRSPSFINRRFKHTTLELICYGIYFLIFTAVGVGLCYLALRSDNLLIIIASLIAGFLLSANFLLLLNHTLHEVFQNVSLDHENGLLISRRFGKTIQIKLDDPDTYKIQYVPVLRKGYGRRSFKFFGAMFSKTVIKNGKRRIQLSGLRHKHFDTSDVREENTSVLKRQINFIV